MCKERKESWRNENIEELERKHKTQDKLKKMATKKIIYIRHYYLLRTRHEWDNVIRCVEQVT